jgi:hypothetical protein
MCSAATRRLLPAPPRLVRRSPAAHPFFDTLLALALLASAVVLVAHPDRAGARVKLGWQGPVRLAAPVALDVFGVQAALSAQGAGAVGYGVMDVDSPAASNAFNLTRTAAGRLGGPRRLSGDKQVLAVAWRDRTETVLTGSAETDQTCCSSARTSLASGRGAHTIVTGLAGATDGRLIAFSGRLLAVVGTERGVWASQSDGRGRFGATHKLTGSVVVEAIDAVAAPRNATVIGWATAAPSAISIARGSSKAGPRSSRRLIRVPSGHSIDELSLAPAPARSGGATAVWIESWSDSRARFHSVVMAADLTRKPQRHQLSSGRELAAGLAFAGDASGDQALAWKRCNSAGDCALRATLRPAGRRFGSVEKLSAIDASESPALAVSPSGESLLGWIANGHVLAANALLGAKRLSRAHTVSNTNFAADLGIAFSPTRTALATWTQGTLAQTVMGAIYVGR